ncbi:hypothetical protein ASG20_00145 [Sphingomonas sp. Leaf198]|nr:hypothetical protein ASG20_00145 [Sphingomonas sp. Leaf198]
MDFFELLTAVSLTSFSIVSRHSSMPQRFIQSDHGRLRYGKLRPIGGIGALLTRPFDRETLKERA